MKKNFFMVGKILLVLIFIIFLPVCITLYILNGRMVPKGKPVSSPPPSPISVDKVEKIKILIESSATIEEVDEVLEEYAGLKNYGHKIEFLKKHFNAHVVDKHEDDSPELEFILLASSIIGV